MHKVVIDTNVFISGILFGGNPRKLLEAWIDKNFVCCISPELKAEILQKLGKKFLLSSESLGYIEEALDTYCEKYVPEASVTILKDPTDNFLLELSEESQADFLVSGDKEVLSMKHYKNTVIISPREFIETQLL